MTTINIGIEIERLLQFALQQHLIGEEDIRIVRNSLLDLFKLDEPATVNEMNEKLDTPVPILERMLDYAYQKGIIPDNSVTQRDLMDARIMGLLMPRASEVCNRFWQTAKERSIEQATADYYHMSQVSNYIRMDRIRLNEYWQTNTVYGQLEITINLSKPEKDPKQIAAERNAPKRSYPKCLLCPENAGFAGRLNHPARQNHRIIPVDLCGEKWYFQYSPYVYYNEHCILFNEQHTPMEVNERTFEKLLSFIDQFPHYFIGSNADLPIVGGSILSHDHFQGGRHHFPMEQAAMTRTYRHPTEEDVSIGIVHWPLSVVRLASSNRKSLVRLASKLLEGWRSYSDMQVQIAAYTEEDGNDTPHNTITPIARMNKAGLYELDLVLRNNRTSPEHPDGIFHPHQDVHHIKKENIGLIEVMGLAVLPGRLKQELELIKPILMGEKKFEPENLQQDDLLYKHIPWIHRMLDTHGSKLTHAQCTQLLQEEVGLIFQRVLEDAGVFKQTKQGQEAFDRFLAHIGFIR